MGKSRIAECDSYEFMDQSVSWAPQEETIPSPGVERKQLCVLS